MQGKRIAKKILERDLDMDKKQQVIFYKVSLWFSFSIIGIALIIEMKKGGISLNEFLELFINVDPNKLYYGYELIVQKIALLFLFMGVILIRYIRKFK